ncbi:hypothetical protein ARMSODRAFT_1014232 [Armillaria solidipes]|uniref:Uncharacterized protein n=1 Tax=Armillaria solidipes TaxID=1076256 RepID=A0A2H3BSP1_9AGAR|nr:hypothetical protein ARMSODRAFT_1014232 [Armillaria solidipes]
MRASPDNGRLAGGSFRWTRTPPLTPDFNRYTQLPSGLRRIPLHRTRLQGEHPEKLPRTNDRAVFRSPENNLYVPPFIRGSCRGLPHRRAPTHLHPAPPHSPTSSTNKPAYPSTTDSASPQGGCDNILVDVDEHQGPKVDGKIEAAYLAGSKLYAGCWFRLPPGDGSD